MSAWWSIASAVISLIGVAAAIIAVRERARYLALRQELDRQHEWMAYMANPRGAARPEPISGRPDETLASLGKREYEPDDDYGVLSDLVAQTHEPPDFFELAPEAEEAHMINIANRQPQQVGMDEPEFEKDAS